MKQHSHHAAWTESQVEALFHLPFGDLLYKAQTVHRENFSPNQVQKSRLVNIKVGGCPEDCKYCSQSIRYNTDIKMSKLMDVADVVADAKRAKAEGASRYCMGAAWRNPQSSHMSKLVFHDSGSQGSRIRNLHDVGDAGLASRAMQLKKRRTGFLQPQH